MLDTRGRRGTAGTLQRTHGHFSRVTHEETRRESISDASEQQRLSARNISLPTGRQTTSLPPPPSLSLFRVLTLLLINNWLDLNADCVVHCTVQVTCKPERVTDSSYTSDGISLSSLQPSRPILAFVYFPSARFLTFLPAARLKESLFTDKQ